MSAPDSVGAFLDDLLSLEVNTILKPSMTATKIPNAAHALIDIARDYAAELNRIAADGMELPGEVVGGNQTGTFNDIRERAATAAKAMNQEQSTQLLMLCRIRDMSDQLKGLIPEGVSFTRRTADDAVAKLRLDHKNQLVLRKAWELGTEQVVLQTVIYLDGDVITRIRPDCATDRALVDVHQQGVRVSIQFWQGLIDIVKGFFGAVASVARAD